MSSETTPTEKTTKPVVVHKPKNNALAFVTFLLVLVVIGALSAAAWYGYPRYEAMNKHVEALQMQIAMMQAETVQQDVALQGDLQRIETAQNNLREQVEHNADRLGKLPGAERQDWLLAEAEYLLRMANQRLQLERDWNGALSMLQAADNVLVETRNPRLNPVRVLLAQEMLALRSMPAIDTEGAVFRIQALQDQIPNLPWIPDHLISDSSELINQLDSNDGHSSEAEPWYESFYNKVTDTLSGMIRIRQRSEVVAPLSPDQHYFMQQNMQLMLEQAQVALLREQPIVYKRSLERVENWLKTYLLVDDERTKAVFSTLNELKHWNVAPTRPDISASLLKLQQIVEQNRRGTVTPAGESA